MPAHPDLFSLVSPASPVTASMPPILNLAGAAASERAELRDDLGQFFTPTWAAEAIVSHFFPQLGPQDFVVEPACGHGAFLGAIPDGVACVGVEIDAAAAEIARRNTGRPVICGDFRTVELPRKPTAIIGNPPFESDLVAEMLDRAHGLMDEGGRVGLIVPCYFWQTAPGLFRHARCWSMRQEMIPRSLFPGLSMPIGFTLFEKQSRPVLQGFFLYAEAAEVAALSKAYRQVLARAPRSAWVQCVAEAVRSLGGRATLDQLYATIGGRRPTETRWWKEKVRQVAQAYLRRVDEGTYALAA